MDGESSYESDISESWSLIDINLNEELLPATDTSSELQQKNSLSNVKKVKLRKIDEIELEDFLRKCKDLRKTDFNEISDSDSSVKDQELRSCSRTELDIIDFPFKKTTDNEGKNDSGDAESIEILDMDGNCQDSDVDRLAVSGMDQLDFVTYQSDDEESSEGGVKIENKHNSSTAIKRKRRKISRNSEDIVYSINSENYSLVSSNFKVCSSDAAEKNGEDDKVSCTPVYKHYRNNVANTVLNLSVGVIFAGVACMAIGHFLGVQNAAETATELTVALKKLQVENAALQSRLFHLNKALLTREMNHKLELPTNQPHNEFSCEDKPQFNPTKIAQNSDLNNAALSDIRSNLTFIEWLSKLQNFVRRNKGTDIESGIDFSNFGKDIHDQLYFLNSKEESSYITENIGKISKVLQKIVNLVSTSQENIEDLYHRIIKLKNIINHKLNKILLDSPDKLKRQTKRPVTELDLQTIQWVPNDKIPENSEREYSESIALYKFPQPQKYYETENNIKSIKEAQLEPIKPNGTLNSSSFRKAQKGKKYQKKYKQRNEKKREKKHEKNDWKKSSKKEKFKEKEKEFKKKEEKRKKRAINNEKKNIEKIDSTSKKEDPSFNTRQVNHIIKQDSLNKTNSPNRKYSKLRGRNLKHKNSKLKKLLSEAQNISYMKKNEFAQICSGPQCFNLTGYWIFKWAGGREELRRYHSLGEWQFKRAEGRKEVRDVAYNDNWQFERAKARKKLRMDDHNEKWQFKRAFERESNRQDDRWHREKHMKYNGKEFFHESFSWI